MGTKSKDIGIFEARTRKHKERRAETHKRQMLKLQRKQERRIEKLKSALEARGIDWDPKQYQGRRSLLIRYMQRALDKVKIK